MAHHTTNPTTLEDCQAFTTGNLSRYGYLTEPGRKGRLSWTYGNQRSAIAINTAVEGDAATLELRYTIDGKPLRYQIELIATPSNLGPSRGKVWSFVCPVTGKTCRKLYLLGRYFAHRSADPTAVYNQQTKSKLDRLAHTMPERWPSSRPTHYRGKITKPYARYLRQMEKADDGLTAFIEQISKRL
jgi:hypothetical protein